MDPLSIMTRIAKKTAPGKQPAYFTAHVLKALELIESGFGVGRQRLAKELGLGEGSARTIVRRLKDEGLIEINRDGMALTDMSRELLNGVRNYIQSSALPQSGMTVGMVNYAVLVRGAADQIKSGLEQRDSALLAGAKGATTMVYRSNRFVIPGMEVEPSNEFANYLVNLFKPEKGDIVIIGTADNLLKAELGAKAAALELLN